MTKTIKFNLVIDGNAVRTIEDLQNNFVLDDVIKYYHNGLLKKWLQVREYNIYIEKFITLKKDILSIQAEALC